MKQLIYKLEENTLWAQTYAVPKHGTTTQPNNTASDTIMITTAVDHAALCTRAPR